MANSTVCQSKWKPIVEPRRAKPKTYRQAPTHWLKFYEEAVIESEARTAVMQSSEQIFQSTPHTHGRFLYFVPWICSQTCYW